MYLLLLLPALLIGALSAEDVKPQQNANHIFNAIHSSMRQFGSSLNHNGMSFFLATVPRETRLYHGTNTASPVQGMEWLAFEAEHALMFARPRFGRPPSRGGHGDPHRGPPTLSPQHNNHGHLHTYRTKRDLHLLYIDGMSAAKTSNGTLDSTDHVLLDSSLVCSGICEHERATMLCKLAETEWGNRVDGILRMEAGFEIIMCSFEKNLDIVAVARIDSPKPRSGDHRGFGTFQLYKAISDRFHGIGGTRVKLDYENFVTAYDYPIDLFRNQDSNITMPRLRNVSQPIVDRMRKDIRDMIMMSDLDSSMVSHNWQATTDMIVQRYSSPLRYLISDKVAASNELLRHTLTQYLRSFIDDANRDRKGEVTRCAAHMFPTETLRDKRLASRSVYDVSKTICSTLFEASALAASRSDAGQSKAVDIIRTLVEYLQWTSWKECTTCDDEHLCFIPIWPMGSIQDHRNPSCLNETMLATRHGYWGRWQG
ncbi:hypothetical protein EJ05DRAFT_437641 [Pseudovirgaria hyperparasitica]|uniref:Uncharacterized protein n=1 Tax=Pseudovirgaria hyperparasitica TaxID=470096 RepID=A0A6A6WCJ8_9PEZI|nr:uncharacterized protein EJ05DRAFT_437641 [Pseudovirgaria hyperparasitica]KAF2759297.1 hypothetical protein EJ05DRAFT_437641 [Pseudovirgaria hyperparasitica]